MVDKAVELAEKFDGFHVRQFENDANPDMHSRTTAREIIADFSDTKLDYWVTGFGTGGTLKGVSRVLRKELPDTKITADAVAMNVIDRLITISGPDAIRRSHELAREEGIFVGITSGATFAGALEVCEAAAKGSNILCMLPDTGERYLSTPLFESISPEMNDAEWEFSRSTPIAQFEAEA